MNENKAKIAGVCLNHSATARWLIASALIGVFIVVGVLSIRYFSIAVAGQTAALSANSEFVLEMKSLSKQARSMYDKKKSPLTYYNNELNPNCVGGDFSAYADDYIIAKAIGEKFFEANLKKLFEIEKFVKNCAPGSIIELPADDDASIAELCSFSHSIVHIKTPVGSLVLCEREGGAAREHHR